MSSTQYIDKRLAHAEMRIYTCQFTYQIILVQDIDECHQKAFPGTPPAPAKAFFTFSEQLPRGPMIIARGRLAYELLVDTSN